MPVTVNVVFLLALFAQICAAYRILGIFPIPSKSHYITGGALMQGLAAAGHNVSVISPFALDKPMANYRDIQVLGGEEAVKRE